MHEMQCGHCVTHVASLREHLVLPLVLSKCFKEAVTFFFFAEANAYLEDPGKYASAARAAMDHTARTNLEAIMDTLARQRCTSIEDCIALARRQFQLRFHDKIAQLIYTFPEDARTSNGTAFWTPPKRFPKVVRFDPEDASHVTYVQAAAILLAQVYGIERPVWAADRSTVAAKAAAIEVCHHLQ
jgi:ubiquitin-activating enzyme E1